MTVVYIDSLFLLNLIVNYILLLATARAAGREIRRLRLGLAAGAGALYAAANFLPGMGFLCHPAIKICAAIVMVLIAFGREGRLLRALLTFFGLACALSGGILAISLLGGTGLTLENGIPSTGMDLKVLLLSASGCYVVLTLVFRQIGRHSRQEGEIRRVSLALGERRASFPVLVDTGNTLTDPVSNRRVLVADWEAVRPVLAFEGGAVGEADVREPVSGMERLGKAFSGRLRLLPYQAVGVSCGMLLAVRTDWVEVDGKKQPGMLVALSPTPVSDGGGYRGLIGA